MNKNSQQLIDHLKSLKQERKAINDLLQADPDGAYVYYLAAYPTVLKIFESGGILPRNAAKDFVDLSGHGVQNRRDRKIKVFNQGKSISANAHDCVNLFFNPLNFTFYQFRRNALLRSSNTTNEVQVVCILEIDLNLLLQNENEYWHIDKNIAQKRYDSQYCSCQEEYRHFQWKDVFSIGKKMDTNKDNRPRATEFLFYQKLDSGPSTVSIHAIKRIIAFEDDIDRSSDKQFQNIKILPHQKQDYQVLQSPLHYEHDFIKNFSRISYYQKISRTNVKMYPITVVKNLIILQNMDKEFDSSFATKYINQSMAYGYHGVGHTLRVAFWVLLLTEFLESKDKLTKEGLQAVLLAAFVHDLARKNNDQDVKHGENAEKEFKVFLKSKLDYLNWWRCRNAVKWHSSKIDPNKKDVVWMLLKDADALDRGRFAPPTLKNGCQREYLRSPVLKNILVGEKIMWAAYWLSKMTQYINWKENNAHDFVEAIIRSFELISEDKRVPKHERCFAKEVCELYLSQNGINN